MLSLGACTNTRDRLINNGGLFLVSADSGQLIFAHGGYVAQHITPSLMLRSNDTLRARRGSNHVPFLRRYVLLSLSRVFAFCVCTASMTLGGVLQPNLVNNLLPPPSRMPTIKSLWHRSGPNCTGSPRRVFYAQYSLGIIHATPSDPRPLSLAVPCRLNVPFAPGWKNEHDDTAVPPPVEAATGDRVGGVDKEGINRECVSSSRFSSLQDDELDHIQLQQGKSPIQAAKR